MGGVGKSLCLLFVILSAASLLVIQPTTAQSIAKPSVPEFTLKYVYRFGNTIDVIIENQPFTSITLPDGHITELRYFVHAENQFSPSPIKVNTKFPLQNSTSVSNQTIVTMKSERLVVDFPYPNGWFLIIDGKMDFKVKVEIGYRDFVNNSTFYYFNVLEESDWSPTQTISLPDGAITISNSPTPSPTVPELSWLAFMPLCLIVLTVALTLKQKQVFPQKTDT